MFAPWSGIVYPLPMPRHPIFSARIQFQAEPKKAQAALRHVRPGESPAEFWRRVLDEWLADKERKRALDELVADKERKTDKERKRALDEWMATVRKWSLS